MTKKILPFVFLFSFFYIHSKAQITQGLVAKYCFDGNANDFAAGSNNGTVNGAVLNTDRFNNPNSAYSFDGFSGDYIDLGTSTALKNSNTSISFWAYIDSNAHYSTAFNYQPFIMAKNSNAPSAWFEGYALGFWTPTPQFVAMSYQSGTTSGPAVFSTTVQLKTWYHLTLTFDDNNLSFYLNGVLQGSSPVSKSFTTTYPATESVLIGRTNVPSIEGYLNGKIDDLLIYDRVLTGTEVMTNMNSINVCAPENVTDRFMGGNISIHPNPSKGILFLKNAIPEKIERIELINLQGKKIKSITKDKSSMDVNNISAGIYLLQVIDINGMQEVIKVNIR